MRIENKMFERSSINLPWGHATSHKQFEPERFSRLLDTNKQTDKQSIYNIFVWIKKGGTFAS